MTAVIPPPDDAWLVGPLQITCPVCAAAPGAYCEPTEHRSVCFGRTFVMTLADTVHPLDKLIERLDDPNSVVPVWEEVKELAEFLRAATPGEARPLEPQSSTDQASEGSSPDPS